MQLLNLIKYDEGFPMIARSAGRSIVGSINFTLIMAAQAKIRRDTNGVPVASLDDPDPVNSIDNANEAVNAANEEAEARRVRREQGFEVDEMDTEGNVSEFASTPEDPMLLATLLKIIAEEISTDLLHNAGMVQLLSSGKMVPNPFDIAPTILESFERQLKFVTVPDTARVVAEAKALGITPAEVLQALAAQNASQLLFLRQNRTDILAIIRNLHWKEDTDMDADIAEDRLPAINQLRLLKSAEQGLFSARSREITGYSRFGRVDAPGNILAIDGTREKLHDEFESVLKDPRRKAELRDLKSRGIQLPVMNKRPSEVLKEAEAAEKKARKAAA